MADGHVGYTAYTTPHVRRPRNQSTFALFCTYGKVSKPLWLLLDDRVGASWSAGLWVRHPHFGAGYIVDRSMMYGDRQNGHVKSCTSSFLIGICCYLNSSRTLNHDPQVSQDANTQTPHALTLQRRLCTSPKYHISTMSHPNRFTRCHNMQSST